MFIILLKHHIKNRTSIEDEYLIYKGNVTVFSHKKYRVHKLIIKEGVLCVQSA